MSESEWLVCREPRSMLSHLGCKAGDRKRRLFACACCRRAWHLLTDIRIRNAVATAERYADKEASERELDEANDCAEIAYRSSVAHSGGHTAAHAVVSSTAGWLDASYTSDLAALAIASPNGAAELSDCERAGLDAERAEQSSLLRDIVGNPFHPVGIEPSSLVWQGSTVPMIAQSIYDMRTFDRLPHLAENLVKASCTNEDVLGHCRSSGKHVRGCWVIDLLLGKE
jgi:hypothetical protein